MAKNMPVKKDAKDESYLSDGQMEVLADMEQAREIAKKLFIIDEPTPEMIFGLYDRLFDAFDADEDEDEDDED